MWERNSFHLRHFWVFISEYYSDIIDLEEKDVLSPQDFLDRIAPEILKWQSVFLYNLDRLNDFIGQKCLKLKLRSAFVPEREVEFS